MQVNSSLITALNAAARPEKYSLYGKDNFKKRKGAHITMQAKRHETMFKSMCRSHREAVTSQLNR